MEPTITNCYDNLQDSVTYVLCGMVAQALNGCSLTRLSTHGRVYTVQTVCTVISYFLELHCVHSAHRLNSERGASTMGHIFAATMPKGGVGKTTTVQNLGVNLGRLGAKVLLVDLDPQANLSIGMGINLEELQFSIYDVLHNPRKGSSFAIISTKFGVDLLPSRIDLAGAELDFAGATGREMLLKIALRDVVGSYDYIIIDAPPTLGLFSMNAMTAANLIIVPLQLQVYAFRAAMPQLEAGIEVIRERLNPEIEIGGIVGTMFDGRTNLSKTVDRQARAQYGELVFETVIPLSTKLAESPAAGEPISVYDPEGSASIAYAKLTREVVGRYGFK
jgi:chromosome partitioning protein